MSDENDTEKPLSDEQREALKKAFDDLDVDNSGKISRSELRAALQLIGQNPTPEDMLRYMPDEVGEFDKKQFCEFVEQFIPLKTKAEIDKELIDAFEKFDVDKEFRINKGHFKSIMTNMGDEPLNDVDFDTLMSNLDINKDGFLDVTELMRLFSEYAHDA